MSEEVNKKMLYNDEHEVLSIYLHTYKRAHTLIMEKFSNHQGKSQCFQKMRLCLEFVVPPSFIIDVNTPLRFTQFLPIELSAGMATVGLYDNM
jgi:hypothetical protein